MNHARYRWIPSKIGETLPANAVFCGADTNCDAIYVGRFPYSNDMLPAKIIPAKRTAYAAYDGKEVLRSAYEVLVGTDFSWVDELAGCVPPGAVVGGATAAGEPLYIGRIMHNNALTVGKIHSSHGCLYIPYDGKEHAYSQYEALVHCENQGQANEASELTASSPSTANCCICLENTVEMIAVACGHLCMCRNCCCRYRDQLCPICRKPVSSWIKVYA